MSARWNRNTIPPIDLALTSLAKQGLGHLPTAPVDVSDKNRKDYCRRLREKIKRTRSAEERYFLQRKLLSAVQWSPLGWRQWRGSYTTTEWAQFLRDEGLFSPRQERRRAAKKKRKAKLKRK